MVGVAMVRWAAIPGVMILLQSACYTWQKLDTAPAAESLPSRVRIVLIDSTHVVLTETSLGSDSLFGLLTEGFQPANPPRVAYSLDRVASWEWERFSPTRTIGGFVRYLR